MKLSWWKAETNGKRLNLFRSVWSNFDFPVDFFYEGWCRHSLVIFLLIQTVWIKPFRAAPSKGNHLKWCKKVSLAAKGLHIQPCKAACRLEALAKTFDFFHANRFAGEVDNLNTKTLNQSDCQTITKCDSRRVTLGLGIGFKSNLIENRTHSVGLQGVPDCTARVG